MALALLTSDLPFEAPDLERLLEAVGRENVLWVDPSDSKAMAEALERAEIAILPGDLDDRFIRAPKLGWVHCGHAGLAKSARPGVFERGLIVTSSAGRSGPALAEHVMMFALMLSSEYWRFFDAQSRQHWLPRESLGSLRALAGRTMGIVGMGHTGKALARRAKSFDMRVLGYRRRDLPLPDGVDRMFCTDRGEGLMTLLSETDVLALVVSLSDATRHLIGAKELATMRAGSLLINLSRGDVIDQEALRRALESGHIGGAALDVTSPEPLPPWHPLWKAPNLLITPHFTPPLPDRNTRSVEIIIENLARFSQGRPLLNQLSVEDIYTGR